MKYRKSRYAGLVGTFAVHAVIVALLLLMSFALPHVDEEDGMPVVMGDAISAAAALAPDLVPVDVLPTDATPPTPTEPTDQDLITQDEEPTVALPPKQRKTDAEPKPEKTEAERAEEARRLAEEQAERKRRQAEERARSRVAGAFGKGAQLQGEGQSAEGAGTEGSPTGNATEGATTGAGGYGTFSLGGRSLGEGGLPRPTYNVQDEGRVVVDIVVNPAGQVVSTAINRQTNTVNAQLRRAAEEAARRARFNAIDGHTNQTGTITYYFYLK